MPTLDAGISSAVIAVSGETVSLYYSNAGVRTIDAGQAAGVAVAGKIAYKNILNSNGDAIATLLDSSFSFTGNCFTTQRAFPYAAMKDLKDKSWASKLSAITSGFANGEYCIDYQNGIIYGVKATTTASLTSTGYKSNLPGVTLRELIEGEDQANHVMKVEQQFTYTNITSATTTTVKSGAGFLHGITVNTAAAGGVITLYDNTAGSGTKIGTITFPATLLANQLPLPYDIKFTTGLTIVTSASTDLTISTRA